LISLEFVNPNSALDDGGSCRSNIAKSKAKLLLLVVEDYRRPVSRPSDRRANAPWSWVMLK